MNFKNLSKISIDEAVIYILFTSVFIPYRVNSIIATLAVIYILFSNKISDCLQKNHGIWVILFVIYCFVIAGINSNYPGIKRAFEFFEVIVIAKYIRKTITLDTFEKGLDITCIMAIATSVISIFDFGYNQFFLSPKRLHRCVLYFRNSNYLATLFAIVIIVCGYKLLNHYRKNIYYYITAFFCTIGAYLTGSMFVWVEIFIGCAVLLLLTRRHQLLSALFLLAGTCIVILYCIPSIMPRISVSNLSTDSRVAIWATTLEAIKDATPFFGKGFLTYFLVEGNYPGSYNSTHSHSIFLEPILCFGIIGTILIVVYFTYFYKRVSLCRNAQHKHCISSLIIAMSVAILAHGTTDITFLWLQTGLFYALIFASIGIEEKLLKIN